MNKDQNTPVDIQELIKQSFDSLLSDVASGKSERFLTYLAFSARFHQYSSDNRQLIYHQCPTATRVAGYRKWMEEGYQVAKGAKPNVTCRKHFRSPGERRASSAESLERAKSAGLRLCD